MINFRYENSGTHTFLTFDLPEGCEVDTMTLGMITNNKITNIAQTSLSQFNNTKSLKYNVSGKLTLNQFFSGSVNKKKFISVLKGICEGIKAVEDYMIDANQILLDSDYVYVDITSMKVSLICIPILGMESDAKEFFKNLAYTTTFEQTENADYYAKIIQYFNTSKTFSVHSFSDLLEKIEEKSDTRQVTNVVTNSVQAPVPSPVQISEPKKVGTAKKPEEKVSATQQNIKPSKQEKVAPQPTVKAPVKNTAIPQPTNVSNASQLVIPGVVKPGQGGMASNGVAIPGQNAQETASFDNSAYAEYIASGLFPNGKKITKFNLLSAYSAENKAIFDAYMEAQKSSKQKPVKQVPVQKETPAKAITPVPLANSVKDSQVQVNVPDVMPAVEISTAPIVQDEQTMILGQMDDESTEIIGMMSGGGQATFCPYLIRQKNNEKVYVNNYMLKIGRDASYADYVISDNKAVGRSHAYLSKTDNQLFVVDTNSANRTYVNDVAIAPNQNVELNDGDKVKFANEEFIVYFR